MNSFAQNPLDTEITYLKGVGSVRGKLLNEIGISTVRELLQYYPRKFLDRTNIKPINHLKIGEEAVVIGRVQSFGLRKTRRRNFFQIILNDGSGQLQCNWFNGISWISDKFSVNQKVAVFGKIDFYKGFTISHPEHDILDENEDPTNTGKIIAQYSSSASLKSAGLDSRGFRNIITNALLHGGRELSDHFINDFRAEIGLTSYGEAIHSIHQPENGEKLTNAIYRLKFDELFFLQILMAKKKAYTKKEISTAYPEIGNYTRNIYEKLPFNLTDAQIKAMREVRKDLGQPHQMNRLIQGDVGCGKTVVALLSSTIVADNGGQIAVLAPTEILARQHYKSIKELGDLVGLKVELLLGGKKGDERESLLQKVKNGEIQLLIGTHALIQPDIEFKNLGLVVIDEQHRFGVEQRKALLEKGNHPHILAMTATPIPRTLAITYHGDMDVTVIDQLPGNRQPVKTFVVTSDQQERIYNFLRKEVKDGSQCFIVYPIIEESEKLDLKAADTEYKKLSKDIFPEFDIGYIHGKIKSEDRDLKMEAFKKNELQILVATTVIEVGIDIPNATVIVIENADRFGLAQLHQLRGRIGRGDKPGYCILIPGKNDGFISERLKIMESTSDGFEIADEDLRLRGPGDFFGTKQHGYMKLKIADIARDGKIARLARQYAFRVIENDPGLSNPIHSGIMNKFKTEYAHMYAYLQTG
jgi:ATP-dependent DNA helicase RecG